MTAKTETQLAVLGSGAIGGLLAAQLAHAGESVVLWGREPGISEIAARGLTLSGLISRVQPVATASGPLPTARLYLIATKTTANPELLARMAREIPADSQVLVCQNGLDPERDFEQALGPGRVLRAIFFLGAKRLSVAHVEVAFQSRPTLIGGSDLAAAQALAARLESAGHPAEATPDLRRHAWEKVILNGITNPLCALGGRTISEVMTDPRFMPMLHEAMAVAEADGVQLAPDFEEQALRLLARTAGHRGSMWEDVRHGRETEIDQLNARIVTEGDRLGIPVDAHRAVVTELQRLSRERSVS